MSSETQQSTTIDHRRSVCFGFADFFLALHGRPRRIRPEKNIAISSRLFLFSITAEKRTSRPVTSSPAADVGSRAQPPRLESKPEVLASQLRRVPREKSFASWCTVPRRFIYCEYYSGGWDVVWRVRLVFFCGDSTVN
ncbi:hypothetical protein GWI33_019326 [Rhynchophorus ferrugineus]|uniref:Uncharacterized protein n=1 Tax=Rhynchophorus ferrugineus TaxID=354439 RepID=A0A834HYH3_RHYFE|nr:hypothetical protein GWI33_019326 [Rhynchophorus ferrugineus]